MALLANLKIARRLLLAFGLMMVIIVGLSGLAVTSSLGALGKIDIITRAKSNEAKAQVFGTTVAQGLMQLWKARATGDAASWKGQQDAFTLSLHILEELKVATLDAGRAKGLAALADEVGALAVKARLLQDTGDKAASAALVVSGQALEAAAQNLAKSYSGAAISRTDEATNDATRAITIAVGMGVGSLLLGFALSFVISNSISIPIRSITATMQGLASGKLDTAVPDLNRKDEIGAMAGAVQVFKVNMIEADRLAAAEQTAQRQKEAWGARIEQLNREFDRSATAALDTLASAATELAATAGSLSKNSSEAVDKASAVANASTEASVNVQTVAAATEQLSSSIQEISRQIAQSATISGQAVNEATQTRSIMGILSESAQKIDGVVRLISDIAGRTNLLALNATIEAARAGDSGKGFAVVASEVKSLATQTARATDEIASQVAQMQSTTTAAVTAIAKIDEIIGRINEIASAIAAAVEQQNAATSEIANNVQHTAGRTTEVSNNIVGLTRVVEGTGASAAELLGAADRLSHQSETLRSSVGHFLAEIRAA